MSTQENLALSSSIFKNENFHLLVRQRRLIVAQLFVLSALVYFSIPFITTVFPEFFRIRISGAINIGLVYAVLQYPIGGLIAYRYAITMRKIDVLIKAL